MSTTIRRYIHEDGFARVEVTTAIVRCEFIPALGGKLAQLTDCRTGRDWLWRHPRLPYRVVASTENYVAHADTGGWDECFPTVGACRYPGPEWDGVVLPDHGDLWCQSPEWTIEESADAVVVRACWQGLALPYTFERVMTIRDAQVQCSYTVTNRSAQPIHWLWCAHPLMAIEPGMRMLVPSGSTFWRRDAGTLIEEPATAIRVTPQQMWDMQRVPERTAGYSVKLYSAQLPEGYVRLQADDGSVTWTWDVAQIPQLAVFLNAGAWSNDGGPPHFNLGVEPAIGIYDALSDAYAHQQDAYATLAPGQQRSWQMLVELGEQIEH